MGGREWKRMWNDESHCVLLAARTVVEGGMDPTLKRKELVTQAKLAEKAERYEDMARIMKEVGEMEEELGEKERALLSSAYKSVAVGLRSAIRAVSKVEEKSQEWDPDSVPVIKNYREQIQRELDNVCQELITLLSQHLSPKASTPESGAFYKKMEGDSNRYMAEVHDEESYKTRGLAAYQEASRMARESLPPTNHTRLGVALNFSVFHYDIMKSAEEAQKEAKGAFEEAISELDALPPEEDHYQETTTLMKLLKDNLQLWGEDSEEDLVLD